MVEGTRAAYDWSGCPAPTEHAEFDRIRELVREVPGVTLADCVAVVMRERDEAGARLADWLAASGLEGQDLRPGDLLVDKLLNDDAPAETWAMQWRSLVEVDPATLTPGGRRRREAMIAIAEQVRAPGAVSERDAALARAEAAAAESRVVGFEGQEAGNRPPACLDCTDTCTCSSAGCASCPCHGGPAEILRRLCHGGRVVSTAELHAAEIVVARAEGRLWVDEDGCGYVYLPPETP